MERNTIIEKTEKKNNQKYAKIQWGVVCCWAITIKISKHFYPNVVLIKDMINPTDRFIYNGLMYLIVICLCIHIIIAGLWIRSLYKKREARNQNIS